MKNFFILVISLILLNSCRENKDYYSERLNQAEGIMSSNISLEKKYDSIKEIYPDLPKNLQEKYGQQFFFAPVNTSLEVQNKNIVLRVNSVIYPNFKNKVFNEGQVEIYSNLAFANKDFKSIYIYNDVSFSNENLKINLIQPLDNSFNFETGKATESVTIDSSFLSHNAESLDGYIVLKVKNQIGDKYDVVISSFDLTDEWNQYVNDTNERIKFLSKDNRKNENSTQEIKRDNIELYNSQNSYLVTQAERMFNSYLPTILKSKSEGTILYVQESYVGDFTGDELDDVIIYFTYGSGGTMLGGIEAAFYENQNNTLKVVAGFEPDYRFSIDKIEKGIVYCTKIKYDEDDPQCCPSIKNPFEISYYNGSLHLKEYN